MEQFSEYSVTKKIRPAYDVCLMILSFYFAIRISGQGNGLSLFRGFGEAGSEAAVQAAFIPEARALYLIELIPVILYILFAICFLLGFEVYSTMLLSKLEVFISMLLTCVYSLVLMVISNASIIYAGADMPIPFAVLFLGSGFSFALLVVNHLLFKVYMERRKGRPKLLMIDSTDGDFSRLKRLRYNSASVYSTWYERVDTGDPLAVRRSIDELLPNFDSICLLDGVKPAAQKEYIQAAIDQRIKLYVVPLLSDLIYSNVRFVQFDDVVGYCLNPYNLSPYQLFVKRFVDLLGASILLVIALIPMTVAAFLVRISSPGPIFYAQERLTIGKKTFKMYKLRTMVTDAEKVTGPTFAVKNDSRITPIGNILRKCRLDELPQLFNVLAGHMSLVGPRPERPFFVERFEKEIDYYGQRFAVKAGLTSLSHVSGRYSTDICDRTRYDLLYINNYSLRNDIKILLKTSRVIFVPSASEGVENYSIPKMHTLPTVHTLQDESTVDVLF